MPIEKVNSFLGIEPDLQTLKAAGALTSVNVGQQLLDEVKSINGSLSTHAARVRYRRVDIQCGCASGVINA
ncbi:MAG: hypothetical protein U0V48_15040 [Anaerolineales bacterium]